MPRAHHHEHLAWYSSVCRRRQPWSSLQGYVPSDPSGNSILSSMRCHEIYLVQKWAQYRSTIKLCTARLALNFRVYYVPNAHHSKTQATAGPPAKRRTTMRIKDPDYFFLPLFATHKLLVLL